MTANASANMNATHPQHEALNELYAGLADHLVAELRRLELKQVYRAGTRLMTCGELPRQIMILETGEAEILLPCPRRAVSLGAAAPGKVLGLKALMAGEAVETDIVCVTSCSVALLPGSGFLELLRSHPEIYYVVAKILSADLQQADKVLKHTTRRIHRAPRGKFASQIKTIQ
jgi:CRP-like cAMP-binding protein